MKEYGAPNIGSTSLRSVRWRQKLSTLVFRVFSSYNIRQHVSSAERADLPFNRRCQTWIYYIYVQFVFNAMLYDDSVSYIMDLLVCLFNALCYRVLSAIKWQVSSPPPGLLNRIKRALIKYLSPCLIRILWHAWSRIPLDVRSGACSGEQLSKESLIVCLDFNGDGTTTTLQNW